MTYDGWTSGHALTNTAVNTNKDVSYEVPQGRGNPKSGRSNLSVIRSFLEETGPISDTEPSMSMDELRAFVRGHLNS